MDYLITPLAFIVAISILVTVHEFGHFWVARRLGVKVLKFSIGFGPALYSRTAKDGVEYVIAALPLGGYVKMLGEADEEVDPAEQGQTFRNQSKKTRAAIAFAGPAMNFIFAIMVYWMVLVIGDTGSRPVIGEVEQHSIAARVGLQAGDELLKIQDKAVNSWEQAVYRLLSTSVSQVDVQLQVKTKEGQLQHLMIPQTDLAGVLKTDKGMFRHLGIKPYALTSKDIPAVINLVLKGKAADQAGLKQNDRIVSVNGQSIGSWYDWVLLIKSQPGQIQKLVVDRQGKQMNIDLKVAAITEKGKTEGRIGVSPKVPEEYLKRMQSIVQYGPVESLSLAVEKTIDLSLVSLKFMLRLLQGDASVHNLSGPIGIAQVAGQTASYGYIQFLKFMALISVSLAIMNLLPVPVLDGGHLLLIAIEAVRGKPLSDNMMENFQLFGVAILLSLMVLVVYVDVLRLLK